MDRNQIRFQNKFSQLQTKEKKFQTNLILKQIIIDAQKNSDLINFSKKNIALTVHKSKQYEKFSLISQQKSLKQFFFFNQLQKTAGQINNCSNLKLPNFIILWQKMLGLLWLISILIVVVNSQFPKILWTYWDGDQNQMMIKIFIQNHKRFLKNDWQVRVLDSNSVKKYIQKIPYYQGDLDYIDFVKKQHKADFLRILLLSYYGGVYFDMSCILIEDFSWLEFEKLRNNLDVLNKHGSSPEVLFFTYNFYGSQETYFDKSLNQTFEISPGYEIWFIAAVPNSTLLMQYFPILRQGYIDKVITKKGEHKLLDKIVEQQKIEVGIISHSQYLSSLQQLQIIIQRKQHQFDKLRKNNNQSRQLAVWHYKIWHIPCYFGPFSVLYHSGSYVQTFYLVKYSLPMLKNILNRNSVSYFIKLTGSCREQLQYFLTSGLVRTTSQWINPKKYQIYSQSIIHKYLIQNSTFQNQIKLSWILKKQFDIDSLYYENFVILKIIIINIITVIVTAVVSKIIYRRNLKNEEKLEKNQFSIGGQSSQQNMS